MNCQACRQALSARLDGEDHPAERPAVDGHLDSCAPCRGWFDHAAEITRLARTMLAAPESPGVSAGVLDAAPTARRSRAARLLRWLLGALGAAQFLLGVAQITALSGRAHTHPGQVASAGHLWHESAAWNVAIGAGFMWIALRRGRPAGIVPTLTVFVPVLALLSLDDLAAGRVAAGWLLSHGIVLVGYAIVLLLTRPTLDFCDPGTGETPTGRSRRRWSLHRTPDGSRPTDAPAPWGSQARHQQTIHRDEAA